MHHDQRTEQLARIAAVLKVADPTAIFEAWTRQRPDLHRPVVVLAGMPDQEVIDQLGRFRPRTPPKPKCPACDGLGRAEDETGHPTSAPCPTCQGAKYLPVAS